MHSSPPLFKGWRALFTVFAYNSSALQVTIKIPMTKIKDHKIYNKNTLFYLTYIFIKVEFKEKLNYEITINYNHF
jgi:hypothetical protein